MPYGPKQLKLKFAQHPVTSALNRYRFTLSLPGPMRIWSSPSPWFTTTDGYRLYSRFIRPDDAPRLLELFEQLSSESRRRRFHMNVDHFSEDQKRTYAHQLAAVDNRTLGGAVVAVDVQLDHQPIVGVARLARMDGYPYVPPHTPVGQASPSQSGTSQSRASQSDAHSVAEVAVVVRDDFQGRGVGRSLVERLGPLARRMRLRRLIASIDADNLAALRLWHKIGVTSVTTVSHGETQLQIILPE